jgi:branched-chain amino acid transport system ATP-binding protein
LLIVDELSLGLAPKIVEQLFEILGQVNQRGTSVLLVEQFVNMALAHTSRAYVLTKGCVALVGESRDLLSSPELLGAYLGEGTSDGASTGPARRRRRAPRAAKADA